MFFANCSIGEPSEEEPENPKAKGIYECYINGESYRAKGPGSNQFSPNPHFKFSELSKSLSINIYRSNKLQTFNLYANAINGIGTCDKHDLSYFALEIDGVFTFYELLESEKHLLEISEYNEEFDIIAGTFELTYVNENLVDTLRAYGSFDVHYTL